MPLRNNVMIPHYLSTAPSCLIECGGTRVLCTAIVSEGVPPFLMGTGRGWLTAEYAMLPASTMSRKPRDGIKKDSRGVEISRLIGRTLRQSLDMAKLGERTVTIDCDVLEADGGTRTAAITGAYVALVLAVDKLLTAGKLRESPIVRQVAAVSVGIVAGTPVLDLCYAEDSRADVDMNIAMDENGNYIELQGTGEGAVFSRSQLDVLLEMAKEGILSLQAKQREALGVAAKWIKPSRNRLILATNNAHKVRELRAILKDRFDVVSLHEAGIALEVDETGETFMQNAVLKAEAVLRHTGCAALADDSGLMVDALGGAPGVHSARYAGDMHNDAMNNRLLLSNLKDVRQPWKAQFVSALALARPGRQTVTVEGAVYGQIIEEPRGYDGFGYDPLFEYTSGETFAEMTQTGKNAISHRARAMEALLRKLDDEDQGE